MQAIQARPWLVLLMLLVVPAFPGRARADDEFDRLFAKWQKLVVEEGRFNEAVPVAEQLLIQADERYGDSDLRTAQALHCVAWLEHWKQHYDRARELWERSLQCQERMTKKDPVWYSRALVMLANVHRTLGDFPQAEQFAVHALDYRRESLGPQHPETAGAQFALANLQFHFGDYAAAEAGFAAAIAIWQKVPDPVYGRTIALALDRIGNIRNELGDFITAEQYFREALELQQRLLAKDHSFIGVTLADFARNALSLGNMEEAESAVRRSIAILEINSEKEPAILHQPLMTLGEILLARGDLDGADAAFKRTDRNLRRIVGPQYPELGEVLGAWARVSEARGDSQAALSFRQQSVDFLREMLGDRHPRTIRALLSLALSRYFNGDRQGALSLSEDIQNAHEEVLRHILGFGSEAQRLAFQKDALSQGYLDLWASLGAAGPLARGILRSKGVVFDSLMEERRALTSSKDTKNLLRAKELRLLQRQLSGLFALSLTSNLDTNALQRSQTLMAEAQSRLDGLQDEVARYAISTGFQQPFVRASAETAANSLPQDGALIQYLRYRELSTNHAPSEAYGALILVRGKAPTWVKLGEAALCEQKIIKYQHSIRERAPNKYFSNVVAALSEQLWIPVKSLLPETTKQLIVCPDGDLHRVSFAGLLDQDGQFLGERYFVAYASNARDLLAAEIGASNQEATGILLIANPDLSQTVRSETWKRTSELAALGRFGDRNWNVSPLPGAEREVRRIASLARELGLKSVTLRLHADATETALQAPSLPDIVHIAAHATFLNPVAQDTADSRLVPSHLQRSDPLNAMYRGVILLASDPQLDSSLASQSPNRSENDGILSAMELSAMDLSQCSLLVLAGCDTGIGWHDPGDGIFGIRRGAMLAGCRQLLLSLWPIDDQQTSNLLIDFYGDYLRTRDAIGAMGRVQRHWLRDLRKNHSMSEICRLGAAFTVTIQGASDLKSPAD